MKTDLKVYISNNLNPYENLALEKFLLENVLPGQVFLYLWQNQKTVVCGRNQNIWKECNVQALLKDGGYPARRLSGGGAVFHDLGNLNFTFIACEKDYDLEKQLDVIIKAVSYFGICAQKSGRNDIIANGAKFSGNAFYKTNPQKFEDRLIRRCHHGTLMIDVNKDDLLEYLNVDNEKYESKGVDSVKSRVCNLRDLNPEISVAGMIKAMTEAFEEIYKGSAAVCMWGGISEYAVPLYLLDEEKRQIEESSRLFSSDEWLYKNNIKFNVRFNHRFNFGDFDLRLYVSKGIIKKAALYSDAMDEEWVLEISKKIEGLIGATYSPEIIKNVINNEEITKELFK